MAPWTLVLGLCAVGIVLIAAEIVLPTHGFVGLLGGLAILGAVGICFTINQWLGVATLAAAAIATPLGGALFVKLGLRTPIGRRLTLPPMHAMDSSATVAVGQQGVTISELRPIGMVEFDGERIEAMSEHGIVRPGTTVKVVAMANNRPTVRVV